MPNYTLADDQIKPHEVPTPSGPLCKHLRIDHLDDWCVCAVDKTQTGWSYRTNDCTDDVAGCEHYEEP